MFCNHVEIFNDYSSRFRVGYDDFASFAEVFYSSDYYFDGITDLTFILAIFSSSFYSTSERERQSSYNLFHEVLLLPPENTGAFGLLLSVDNYRRVIVETNVRAVFTIDTVRAAYDNGLDYVARFNDSAGVCALDRRDDYVADVEPTEGTAKDPDTHKFFCAAVIGRF